MTCHGGSGSDKGHHRRFWNPPEHLRRWYRLYSLVAGVLALAWLVLRSGPRPSRLAYPCQQAAFSTAAAVFGGALVGAAVMIRRRLSSSWLTPAGLGCLGLIALAGVSSYWGRIDAYEGPRLDPRQDYRAQVFDQMSCPEDPVGDRFLCVEDLIEKMGAQGVKLHRSSTTSLTAGPDGIIGADDVVVIKFNYQWPERGGTNTDLMRGLIRRIVSHPESFTGEIVLCENTQFAASNNFDRSQNNAQDPGLSPRDIVLYYSSLGYDISQFDWTAIRYSSVSEYSVGDMNNGYVVYPYDGVLHGKISYPKFQTTFGTRISLKHGVWDDVNGYDRQRLKFINVPVLKSHHATYGATAMTKHYMGVVTDQHSTNSHGAIHYGMMGALMGEIQPADLNILDAIWINANPNDGPWTTYGAATRTNRLVASLDPIAGDLWAVKYILIPAFLGNDYTPPWPYPSADPDDTSSAFRQYLDNSMNYLLAAGYDATNDMGQIDWIKLGPPGEASDPTGPGEPFTIARDPGGYELTWSSPVRGGPVADYVLYRTSLASLSGGATPHCETALGPGTSAIVPSLPDNHAFLVVGRSPEGEGSSGRNSQSYDRPFPLAPDVCP